MKKLVKEKNKNKIKKKRNLSLRSRFRTYIRYINSSINNLDYKNIYKFYGYFIKISDNIDIIRIFKKNKIHRIKRKLSFKLKKLIFT